MTCFPLTPFLDHSTPGRKHRKTFGSPMSSREGGYSKGSVGKNRLIGILVNTYSESPEGVVKNFTKFANACVGVFFKKNCNFVEKETSTQVFFCEFCEIFKNTFFTKNLAATVSFPNSCFHTVSSLGS